MTEKPKVKRPPNLGPKGRAFWTAATDTYTFRLDELGTLEDYCRTVDRIADMEAELRKPHVSLEVRGSRGQRRAHPLLSEIRGYRETALRLRRSLALPEEDQAAGAQGQLWRRDAGSDRSAQARHAAEARWKRA